MFRNGVHTRQVSAYSTAAVLVALTLTACSSSSTSQAKPSVRPTSSTISIPAIFVPQAAANYPSAEPTLGFGGAVTDAPTGPTVCDILLGSKQAIAQRFGLRGGVEVEGGTDGSSNEVDCIYTGNSGDESVTIRVYYNAASTQEPFGPGAITESPTQDVYVTNKQPRATLVGVELLGDGLTTADKVWLQGIADRLRG